MIWETAWASSQLGCQVIDHQMISPLFNEILTGAPCLHQISCRSFLPCEPSAVRSPAKDDQRKQRFYYLLSQYATIASSLKNTAIDNKHDLKSRSRYSCSCWLSRAGFPRITATLLCKKQKRCSLTSPPVTRTNHSLQFQHRLNSFKKTWFDNDWYIISKNIQYSSVYESYYFQDLLLISIPHFTFSHLH